MRSLVLAAVGVLLAFQANPVLAEEPQSYGARQVVGLFAHTCLQFAGNKEAMRAMLSQRGVPQLTPAARAVFMRGGIGVGYDATTGTTRLALVSSDDGSCSAFGEHADSVLVVQQLEDSLRAMRADYRLVNEHDDPRSSALHHRDYMVMEGGRAYDLLASTDSQEGRIQAMLTLRPRAAE